ncbi:MAG: alpha-amylase family glycosyl hydrolase [Clostridia bacterium]|nr:alpha-amylase family glycosyl hydrolase [Clostridia bacterium]
MNDIFRGRYSRHERELKEMYLSLYGSEEMYTDLLARMEQASDERTGSLQTRDIECESNPGRYHVRSRMGMELYIDHFADDIQGVIDRLPYFNKLGVNYVHLLPVVDVVGSASDGGFAVSVFREVGSSLGTIEDLEELCDAFHEKDIMVSADFPLNHTSEDHEWAKRARSGEEAYKERYFFFDSRQVPDSYDAETPSPLPETAPGNFTYLADIDSYVLTSFNHYQWDLNYTNPVVFNEMVENMLFLTNCGIDIIRLVSVTFLWKEALAKGRNLPEKHKLIRMFRMIVEIVSPSVILQGEMITMPEDAIAYFGTDRAPECHLLSDISGMATIWHTVATRDTRLLRTRVDTIENSRGKGLYLNWLRAHDDIFWQLDFNALNEIGMEENAHKRYLNGYFCGNSGYSTSRGEIIGNPDSPAATFCGTTASMAGIEKAGYENNANAMARAIRLDVMLHAFLLTLSGVPMLCSGDELGLVNDYTYKNDPMKVNDKRNLHRVAMQWDLLENIDRPSTVQGRIFPRLQQLISKRANERVFDSDAHIRTLETWDNAIICIERTRGDERLLALFNFSEHERVAWLRETDDEYVDLITGERISAVGLNLPAHGFYWLKRVR